MNVPDDHFTSFPIEWWTSRRKRDYFIDRNNRVRLRPNSPTGKKVSEQLVTAARNYAVSK